MALQAKDVFKDEKCVFDRGFIDSHSWAPLESGSIGSRKWLIEMKGLASEIGFAFEIIKAHYQSLHMGRLVNGLFTMFGELSH